MDWSFNSCWCSATTRFSFDSPISDILPCGRPWSLGLTMSWSITPNLWIAWVSEKCVMFLLSKFKHLVWHSLISQEQRCWYCGLPTASTHNSLLSKSIIYFFQHHCQKLYRHRLGWLRQREGATSGRRHHYQLPRREPTSLQPTGQGIYRGIDHAVRMDPFFYYTTLGCWLMNWRSAPRLRQETLPQLIFHSQAWASSRKTHMSVSNGGINAGARPLANIKIPDITLDRRTLPCQP